MSADTPERPDRDDLEQAYARSHSLADDGRAPSASVRANVLAAAREVAAQANARVAAEAGATPPLAPVASPVAAVGRGRALAVNLSSWRVRSGAAVCAALLVALGVWRFDASHRFDGGVQVATASLELAAPPTVTIPKDLAAPPLSAASVPYLPPPVVDDPVDSKPGTSAVAKQSARDRDRDVIVAQAEQSDRAPRAAQAEARVEARRALAPIAPPVRDTTQAATPAPAPLAPAAPAAQTQPSDSRTTVTLTAAAAPPQLATMPPMPPSVVPRRVPVASPAKPASEGDVTVAAADPGQQRVEITGSSIRRLDEADAAPAGADAAKKARLAMAGVASARQSPAALQSAAEHGDVEALKTLLADPATRVDAPDAAGRTALLHAVLAQQVAAVRLLMAAGADPARADQTGLTPRVAAQAGANAEISALLAGPR